MVELYIASNPNYLRKNEEKKVEEPKPVEKVETADQATGKDEKKQHNAGKKHAFDLFAQFLIVRQQLPADIPEPVSKSMKSLGDIADTIFNCKFGDDFDRQAWEDNMWEFSKGFTKLSKPKAPRLVCEDGVSYGDLRAFVEE